MAVTRLAAAVASTSNTNSYAGPSATPSNGELLLAFVKASGTTAVPTMTGGGLTWTLLTSFTLNGDVDTLYIFWATVSNAAATQPTFDCTGDNATGAIIACARVTGLEGQAQPYIRQMKSATGTGANPAVTLDKAVLTGNGVFLIGSNIINSTTQWSHGAFTEMDEAAYNTPPNSLGVFYRLSGETGTTLTLTNAQTAAWGIIAIEFYVAGTGPTEGDPAGMMGVAGVAY